MVKIMFALSIDIKKLNFIDSTHIIILASIYLPIWLWGLSLILFPSNDPTKGSFYQTHRMSHDPKFALSAKLVEDEECQEMAILVSNGFDQSNDTHNPILGWMKERGG